MGLALDAYRESGQASGTGFLATSLRPFGHQLVH